MKPWMVLIGTVAALTAMSGCARKDTRVFAQDKEYVPAESAPPWKIGGVFDKKEHTVVISFNGENVLRGRFPATSRSRNCLGRLLSPRRSASTRSARGSVDH